MSLPRLAPGQIVAGQYSIRAALRHDGAIASYVAVTSQQREVVLKLYAPELTQRADIMSALQNTHGLVNMLPSTNVAHVLDAGVDPGSGSPYTASARLAAASVSDTAKSAHLTVKQCLELLRSIAKVLDAAHAQGLLHHALKPGNVLVAGDGSVRLTDFGVNLIRASVPTHEAYAFAAPWMAPEQLQGAQSGPAADVFSLALVAFFALTGASFWTNAVPFDAARFQQEMTGGRATASARALQLGITLPSTLDVVFARALAQNPNERHATAAAFAAAFNEALSDAAPPASTNRRRSPKHTDFQMLEGDMPQGPVGPRPAAGMPVKEPVAEKAIQTLVPPEVAQARFAANANPSAGVDDTLSAQRLDEANAVAALALAPEVSPSPANQPSLPPEANQKKKSLLPLFLVLFLVFGGGGAAAYYFLVLVPAAELASKKKGDDKDDDEKKGKKSDGDSKKPQEGDKKDPDKKDPEKKDPEKKDPEPAASGSASTAAPSASVSASASGSGSAATDDLVPLVVKCTPACDSLTVDGKKVDDLSAAIKLPPGSHEIVAGKAGFKSISETINVKKGSIPIEKSLTLVSAAPAPTAAPPGTVRPPSVPVAKPPCGKLLKRCD